MEKNTQNEWGLTMSARFVKVPKIGQARLERFKITLTGVHTLEEKMLMAMKGLTLMEHHRGIFRASDCDLWLAPIDEHDRPLAFFGDGEPIAGERLIIDNPYSCAADIYNCR